MSFTTISTATLAVTRAPAPLTDIQNAGKLMVLSCTGMQARGEVTLGGAPGAPPPAGVNLIPRTAPFSTRVGWRAGWVQLFTQEKVQGVWTSPDPTGGGLLEEHDTFTALDGGDEVASEYFCSQKPGFYHRFTPERPTAQLAFIDIPIHYFEMEKPAPAGKGPAPFRLASVQLRFSFILALLVRDPEDHFHVLKSLPWTFHLQYRRSQLVPGHAFESWAVVPSGTRAGAGNVTPGAPQALVSLLQNPPRQSANQLASAAPTTRILGALELKRHL